MAVATRWRIRHKLMLGLGLVVLLMALLLGGTLRGLWSYYNTTNSVRAKLAELNEANDLLETIAPLVDGHVLEKLQQRPWLVKDHTTPARKALAEYREQLEINRLKTEVEDSYEVELLEVLTANLDEFERLITRHTQPRMLHPGQERHPLGEEAYEEMEQEYREGLTARVPAAVGLLMGPTLQGQVGTMVSLASRDPLPLLRLVRQMTVNARDLRRTINDQLDQYLGESRRHYQITLWIILPASVVGLLSLVALVRFFYGWVFNPIRDVAAGVKRVAQGDFKNPLQVQSGDEMEELAAAFNDMMQRLAELYGNLAQQVNERSRQLVRSERLASVGYLAAGVAHEINNPLHSIALCSEALDARLRELLTALGLTGNRARELDVISRYLRMIQEEAFRCKQITERLLEFSRPGERKRETTDLVALVRSVIDSVEVLPHSSGKKILLEGGADRLAANKIRSIINAEEVRSVLLNLAINAMESMEDGGILRVAVLQRNGMAELRFTDTGCGMTPEVLENIFEPFFTRNRTGKGTGLGLTISHRIIQQHGGEIEAASPGPNQGSTFIVRLPLMGEMPTTLPFPGSGRQVA